MKKFNNLYLINGGTEVIMDNAMQVCSKRSDVAEENPKSKTFVGQPKSKGGQCGTHATKAQPAKRGIQRMK